jgi:hypothetical protein
MFLVGDTPEIQASQIRNWLRDHPSVALLVAATYFEWTLCRVLIALSARPNTDVRHDLAGVFGLERYKEFWRSELSHLSDSPRLPEVVVDWRSVTDAFDARNRIVHGRDRYTRNMASPHVDSLLKAVADLREFSLRQGFDVANRLPVRRKAATNFPG